MTGCIFTASLMANDVESHCFYKLLRLHAKKVRYEHHYEFLLSCQARDVVPDGLRLHKTANIDSFSEDFTDQWMEVLNGASKALRDLITTETEEAVANIERNIFDLERSIIQDYGLQVRDKFVQKSMDICGKLRVSLGRRRSDKLRKLCPDNQDIGQCNGAHDFVQLSSYSSGSNMNISETIQGPSNSRIEEFIAEIRGNIEHNGPSVRIEDVGPEESLNGINPLPLDSPLLMVDLGSLREVHLVASNLDDFTVPCLRRHREVALQKTQDP